MATMDGREVLKYLDIVKGLTEFHEFIKVTMAKYCGHLSYVGDVSDDNRAEFKDACNLFATEVKAYIEDSPYDDTTKFYMGFEINTAVKKEWSRVYVPVIKANKRYKGMKNTNC